MQTILCIDDNRAVLETLSLILRAQGYCCITAQSNDEADRRFIGNPIDLIIVDHGLPDLDGATLASRLKRVRPVRVLMLTGNPNSRKPASVDLMLPKPQEPEDLIARIEELLQASD